MSLRLVVKGVMEESFFDDFWEEYPRKVSKKMAKKAWDKISPNQELAEKIICALYQQKKYWKQKEVEIQFIPHASTWLNQERWEDELELEKSMKDKIMSALRIKR